MFFSSSPSKIQNPKSSIENRQSLPLPSIVGLAEDEFPSDYAMRDLKLEEEKRLFYVALTHAKRHLILSSYQINDWGHEKPPSSFLTDLI